MDRFYEIDGQQENGFHEISIGEGNLILEISGMGKIGSVRSAGGRNKLHGIGGEDEMSSMHEIRGNGE